LASSDPQAVRGVAVREFSLTYEGFDPQAEGLREVLTSTGNGRFCARGAAEWEDADGVHYPGTYAHGIHNRETTAGGPIRVGVGDEIHELCPGDVETFEHAALVAAGGHRPATRGETGAV
jgi:trehalose/maltose hydrolase-like predicted phosphorylase